MNLAPLSRRKFLRLFLAASGGVMWAACSLNSYPTPTPKPGPTDTTAPEPTPTPTTPPPDNQFALGFDGGSGDAWTWKKRVTGRTVRGERCRSITLRRGDASVEARRDGDRFSGEVPLAEAENRITAVCAHEDGREYASIPLEYTPRLTNRPKAVIGVAIQDGRVVLDGAGSQPSEGDRSPIVSYEWSEREGNPASVTLGGSSQPRIAFPAPGLDGEYYVSLKVRDEAGREDVSSNYFVVEGGKPRVPEYATEHPAWVDSAVVYGVIPRAFGSEGLRDVTRRLDYLKDLGIDGIWLAPINETPPGDYGYAVTDYFKLRSDGAGGTEADLRALVQGAHKRGIRVLMDFVPSHTSIEHPYFLDTKEKGRASAYYDFYERDEAGNYKYYFHYEHLPNLNYDNPEVERMITEAFSYWVREFDVDGFRVDFAWAIRERRPEYWPAWRREMKRLKPDLLLLAEAGARDPYYFTDGFDAAYDWGDNVGHWAWENVFEAEALLVSNLDAALTSDYTGFHPDALIFRFLNNNDTGARFVDRYGVGMTRVATALLLTLHGLPCIYMGDEVGEKFQPYDESCCLSFEDKLGLREYHKTLIALRKGTPSLRSREWRPLEVKLEGRVQYQYAYLRYQKPAEAPVLVVLNFSDQARTAELTIPEEFGSLTRLGVLNDLLNGGSVQAGRGEAIVRIRMPAWGARVLSAPDI